MQTDLDWRNLTLRERLRADGSAVLVGSIGDLTVVIARDQKRPMGGRENPVWRVQIHPRKPR